MGENTRKYMILVNWVKEQIKEEKILPGEKLPSENELSNLFPMSRQTVRHAISLLEQEQIVERRQGSGTYVCQKVPSIRKETRNIAVVTTYVNDYIFPTIIREIETVLSKAGYTVQIAFTHNQVEKEAAALKNILDRDMIDGIIIEPTKSGIPTLNLELYQEVIRRKIPMIFINSYHPQVTIPHISLDDRMAGKIATEYLVERGHQKIAGIFKSDDLQGHLRYAGYSQALMDTGIKRNDEHVLWFDTEDLLHLQEDGDRLLRRLQGCTGCVCYNDQIGLEVVKLCLGKGIRIPEDLSITSIDNSELASLCEVPLTSVELPMELLGREAAGHLLHMIGNPGFKGGIEFSPRVKERDSVKKV